jgi:hypothetical protein
VHCSVGSAGSLSPNAAPRRRSKKASSSSLLSDVRSTKREIEDRAAFLEEAKAMGLKGEPIKRVEFEISTRKHELEQRM